MTSGLTVSVRWKISGCPTAPEHRRGPIGSRKLHSIAPRRTKLQKHGILNVKYIWAHFSISCLWLLFIFCCWIHTVKKNHYSIQWLCLKDHQLPSGLLWTELFIDVYTQTHLLPELLLPKWRSWRWKSSFFCWDTQTQVKMIHLIPTLTLLIYVTEIQINS